MSQTATSPRQVINPPRFYQVTEFVDRLSDELLAQGGDVTALTYDQASATVTVTVVEPGAAQAVAGLIGLAGPVTRDAMDGRYLSWVGRTGARSAPLRVEIVTPIYTDARCLEISRQMLARTGE